jgi:phosphoglycerol transferase MdoB-like AlkP superfamily enzyme
VREKPRSSFASYFTQSRFRILVVFGGFLLALALITRLVLLTAEGAWRAHGPIVLVKALAVGEVYDLVSCAWVLMPFALYLTLVPERWFASRLHRTIAWGLLAASVFGALFVAVVEYFFFEEFNGRFNFVAVDYLLYPTEVVENIWQSYPTGKVLIGIGALTLTILFLPRRKLAAAWDLPSRPALRLAAFVACALPLAGLSWEVSPKLAQVSEDRALNELASNGYYSFFQALLGADAPYEGLYASRPQGVVLARLQRLLADPEIPATPFAPGSTFRRIDSPGSERPMNVVVVLEESLGSEFIGALKPRGESLTPQFDALTAKGTLLTHAYSTGNRTIRAIEATTASLPPLPGTSIVRRSASAGLFTLPSLLKSRGYLTAWIYGGRALFDGMGGYLSRNGVDRIVDQADMPDGAFTTAWGACDEAIFDRALVEMDAMHATGKPFYSLILSVSNHRPFTFPEDAVQPDPRYRRRENAVRYADHSLGRFMRQAEAHDFYRNTVFVLMGDHGARVYGAAEIPLGSYEVPILFLAPGVPGSPPIIPQGQRLDTLASSLDVPTTLLGILGFDYDSPFFGQDLFRIEPGRGRAFMTHNNQVALMRGGQLASLGLHEAVSLYDYDAEKDELRPSQERGVEAQELIEDAIAYYSGADRLYRSGKYRFPGR